MRNKATNTSNDWKKIRQYVDTGSQAAFSELVKCYINLVYCTCLRETRDSQTAEDTTQAVFLILSQKAATFKPDIILPAWLFTTSRFASKNAIRERRLRAAREERIAQEMNLQMSERTSDWDTVDLHLNDLLHSLPHKDRDAILLRYFEGYSLLEVGEALGITENTARMRISRTIEKMRKRLLHEGVTITGVALLAMLSTEAVKAAPLPCRDSLLAWTSSSAAGNSTGFVLSAHIHQISEGALRSMSILKWKAAALIAAGSLTGIGAICTVAQSAGRTFHATRSTTTVRAVGNTSSDPKAVRLMQQMIAAYGQLKSYTDTETAQGSPGLAMPYQLRFVYRKPDKMEMIVSRQGAKSRIVSDNQFVDVASLSSPYRYSRMPIRKGDSIAQDMLNAGRIQEAAVPPLMVNGAIMLQTPGVTYKLGKPQWIYGVMTDTVLETYSGSSNSYSASLSIGRADHLLRQMRESDNVPGNPTSTSTQAFTNIRVNPPLPDSRFQFKPHAGAPAPASKPQVDQAAQAIVKAMYDAYNSLNSFSCEAECASSNPGTIADGRQVIHRTIRSAMHATYIVKKGHRVAFLFSDPNSELHVVSDGTTAYATGRGTWNSGKYLKEKLDDAPFNAMSYLLGFAATFGDHQSDWMPGILLGLNTNPVDDRTHFMLGPQTTLNGAIVDTVTIPGNFTDASGAPDEGSDDITFFIGHDDHFLRRVAEHTVFGHGEGEANSVDTYTNIKANPNIPDSTFIFTPKPGLHEVTTIQDLR